MWIPDFLYKRLPFLYAAAGGACVLFLGASGPGGFSAALLVAAAVRTYTWQRE